MKLKKMSQKIMVKKYRRMGQQIELTFMLNLVEVLKVCEWQRKKGEDTEEELKALAIEGYNNWFNAADKSWRDLCKLYPVFIPGLFKNKYDLANRKNTGIEDWIKDCLASYDYQMRKSLPYRKPVKKAGIAPAAPVPGLTDAEAELAKSNALKRGRQLGKSESSVEVLKQEIETAAADKEGVNVEG